MEEKTKQWYEENSELLEAEKAAMEELSKGDYSNLLFLKEGRVCRHIGFNSKLSGRRYNMALICSHCHPKLWDIIRRF